MPRKKKQTAAEKQRALYKQSIATGTSGTSPIPPLGKDKSHRIFRKGGEVWDRSKADTKAITSFKSPEDEIRNRELKIRKRQGELNTKYPPRRD